MTLNAPEGPRIVGFTVQPLSSRAQNPANQGLITARLGGLMRGNETTVKPEQLLQFRMVQPAFVPIKLKDGHQVDAIPVDATATKDSSATSGQPQ
jgi:hypothetical protein